MHVNRRDWRCRADTNVTAAIYRHHGGERTQASSKTKTGVGTARIKPDTKIPRAVLQADTATVAPGSHETKRTNPRCGIRSSWSHRQLGAWRRRSNADIEGCSFYKYCIIDPQVAPRGKIVIERSDGGKSRTKETYIL